jgi:hypothetical protein
MNRMCPPGKIHYFYSSPKTLIWDKSYKFVTKKEKNVKFIDVNDVLIKYGKRIKKIRPKTLHEYFNNKNTKVIKLPDYLPTIN